MSLKLYSISLIARPLLKFGVGLNAKPSSKNWNKLELNFWWLKIDPKVTLRLLFGLII